jgi:hypothetical protein
MSHYADLKAAIRQRLVANWTTTPLLFENVEEEQIKTNGQMPDSFVACETLPLMQEQKDLGGGNIRGYRTRGIIKIYIFTPAGDGDGLGMEYADTIAAIFRGKTFDGVVCYAPSIRDSGADKSDAEGRYWRITLGVEFYYDQVFSV